MPALSEATFDGVVSKEPGLVLVDCYSENCASCEALEPTLDDLESEFSDTIRFFRLNVVENPDLMGRFSLFSVPTLMFLHRGKPVAEIIGAFPKKTIRLKILSLLEGLSE